MKRFFNRTLIVPLLVNLCAALLMFAFQNQISRLPPAVLIGMAVTLAAAAAFFAMGPAAVMSIARKLRIPPNARRALTQVAVATAVQLFVMLGSIGLLLFISLQVSGSRIYFVSSTLGPLLAFVALGAFTAFSGARYVATGIKPSLEPFLPIVATFVITALLVQHTGELQDIPIWRLVSSMSLGAVTLSFVQGFLHGYIEG